MTDVSDAAEAFLKNLADRLDDDGRLIDTIAQGIEKQFKQPERRARPVDYQGFDEIVIRTVPRYKTSHLSGNMWRIGAKCEIRRKGRVVWEESAHDVPSLLDMAARYVHSEAFTENPHPVETDDLCDQEGCNQPWTHTYKVLKEYCRCGHPTDPMQFSDVPLVRKFCERHAQRGDQALEDSQSNYEDLTAGTPPTVQPEDERKADVAGGVIVIQ